jgi:hypothetical protein
MTSAEYKFANELHYAVKGHLIDPNYDEETVWSIHDSYLKRLWGNHERMVYSREHFEKLWEETYGKQSDSKSE